ncbi:superfamily II DNA or RNA helicase [Sphingobium sp. B11D3B]|nr:superfamily II DNA or RNA helicase [Sphingobium sp. B11D3B]
MYAKILCYLKIISWLAFMVIKIVINWHSALALERYAAFGMSASLRPSRFMRRHQARAIAAVREDLASGRPMDRLIIGDVGYGKTEVALRAVALAALPGIKSWSWRQ